MILNKKNITIFAVLTDVRCSNCNKLLTKSLEFTGFFNSCRKCGQASYFIKGKSVDEVKFKQFISSANIVST